MKTHENGVIRRMAISEGSESGVRPVTAMNMAEGVGFFETSFLCR